MTKWQLINAFLNGTPLNIITPGGGVLPFKVINRIEREDGSNHSYNVAGFSMTGAAMEAHIRTED